jgi:hypothetical protein
MLFQPFNINQFQREPCQATFNVVHQMTLGLKNVYHDSNEAFVNHHLGYMLKPPEGKLF